MYSEILTEISVSAAIKRGKEKPFNMYEEMKQEENVLIRYYNVMFFLKFSAGADEFKKNSLIARIESGEKMNMIGVYGWCKAHHISVDMKFLYRRDIPVKANIWNLYSYCRFRTEIWIDELLMSMNKLKI